MKNCKLRFVFPNSLNLYVLGLQATEILIRSLLHFALFNFFATILYQLANLTSI